MLKLKKRFLKNNPPLGVKIDPSNPLAPDAQCIIPSIYLGDLVSKKLIEWTTTKHNLSQSINGTILERTDRFTNAVFVDLVSAPRLSTTDGCTIAFRYYKQNVNLFSQQRILDSSVSGYINLQEPGFEQIGMRHRDGFAFFFSTLSIVPAFEWHDYAVACDGFDRHLYIDGDFVETFVSGGTDFEFDRLMSISHGDLAYFYSYNRQLSAGKLKNLSDAPFQFLQPNNSLLYFPPKSVAGGSNNQLLLINRSIANYGGMRQ